jgi:hypothetical protein
MNAVPRVGVGVTQVTKCGCAAYQMFEVGWYAWDALPQPLFLPFQYFLEEHRRLQP